MSHFNKEIFNLEKRKSASEIVVETIKKLLITKKLLPGDKLPSEVDLAQSLGVSRGSIREAMKELSVYGIVTIRHGDGTYISESTSDVLFDPLLFQMIINYETFQELLELREALELSIIRLAIKHAKDSQIAELENAYSFMIEKTNEGSYKDEIIIEAESKFHTALGKATGNKLFQTVYGFILDLFIQNISKADSDEKFEKEALGCHRAIIDSIIKRDIESGEKAIKESVEVWKDQKYRIETI